MHTSSITVPPNRQRRSIPESHIEDLSRSIKQHGLLHPIILKPDGTLVVGECRLRAWKRLEKLFPEEYSSGIPYRCTDQFEPDQLKAIELAENIQRLDLDWKDKSLAFLAYYEIRSKWVAENETYEDGSSAEYTYAEMSGDLNCSDRTARRQVQVGRKVQSGDPEILACQTARAAGALIERRTKRVIENELVTFGEIEIEKPKIKKKGTETVSDFDLDLDITVDLSKPKPVDYKIEKGNFTEWIDSYTGPKFNFVHCDFPYGINLHESDLYKTAAKDHQYDDSEELYDDLCSALIYAQDNVLSKSCHILFWFPMSKYWGTLRLFTDQGFFVEPYPLIWVKSDKMGIIPDPGRGPRRIYETAFIMSLGDRKILRPTVNAVWESSGGQGKEHVSQKPQAIFADFLRMFIDEDSTVLDPTCGSGTALAAAIGLGANFIRGLDISDSCVQLAEDNCRNQLTKTMREQRNG